MSTRDEIIDKIRNQMNFLHNFAGEVVSVLNEEMLWGPLAQGAEKLFGLKAQLAVEPGDADAQMGFKKTPQNIGSPLVAPLADESIALARTGNLAVAAGLDEKLRSFDAKADQKDFLCICHPLPNRSGRSKVFLLLHNHGKPFVFEPFDQNLLAQLIYFTGAVLTNCGMVYKLVSRPV